MYKIGITGGIGTGKSYVMQLYKKLGAYTLSADEIAKKILNSNNAELLGQIREKLGDTVFTDDGQLDNEKLGEQLFEDPEKRNFINHIVHPKVREERIKIIKSLEETQVYQLLFYESALLVEAGTYKDFDRVVVLYCTPEQQLERIIGRDSFAPKDAEKRIKAQFPLSEKLKVAHYTIDTSGSFDQTETNALEAWSLIRRDLKIS